MSEVRDIKRKCAIIIKNDGQVSTINAPLRRILWAWIKWRLSK